MQGEAVTLILFAFLSLSHTAPREGLPLLNPGGIGGIFEGPDSETIIQGPDGSEITSEQKGGAVIRDDGLVNNPIVVAEPELSYAASPILTEERVVSAVPVISSTSVPILDDIAPAIAPGPIVAPSPTLLTGEVYNQNIIAENLGSPLDIQTAPIIDAKPIEIVEQDPHIIETEIIDASGVESGLSADLKGASGRIITKGSASIVSGPASTTITEPRKIIIAPPKISVETPLNSLPVLPAVTRPLLAEQEQISVNTAIPISSPSAISYDVSSTLTPPVLSYSTTSSPLVDVSSVGTAESLRIDLGANDVRESIPVVEYGSLKGVISGASLRNIGTYSSSEAPIVSNSVGAIDTGDLSQNEIVYNTRQQPLLGSNNAVGSRVNWDSLSLPQQAGWPINSYQTGYVERNRSY